jgi:hypothetical protein
VFTTSHTEVLDRNTFEFGEFGWRQFLTFSVIPQFTFPATYHIVNAFSTANTARILRKSSPMHSTMMKTVV